MITKKKKSNLEIINDFTLKNLPNLDTVVLAALELFSKTKLPKLNFKKLKRPIILGSGNAAVTGKIIFKNNDAIFANESNYKLKLKTTKPSSAVLISASGKKHAPIMARDLKKRKIQTFLITHNPDAPAKIYIKEKNVFLFPKNREPYTYNTSTYIGPILAHTKENPKKILSHLKKLNIQANLKRYNAFYIIVPNKFDNIREMLHTKFDELFGPKIHGEIFTPEQTKHAKTVIPSKKELYISLGYKNNTFGKNRLNIPLPKSAKEATAISTGYYIIGKIQAQHPPYFKKNIENYTKKASKYFKQEIMPIVE